MKKLYNVALAVLTLVVALSIAPISRASTIDVNDWVKLISYNNIDNAGIMTYAISDSKYGPIVGTYDTFCIQDNVNIWQGETFLIKDISLTVGKFEAPQPEGAGPVVGAVDYLFYLFESGKYNNELYNDVNKKAYQADLQNTLWNLQGSILKKVVTATGTPWAKDLVVYNNDTDLHKSWGTQVLNIVDSNGHGVQNQLYNKVPEPSTMVLLLLGCVMVSMAAIKWKFKK